jgi:hypothetical protein
MLRLPKLLYFSKNPNLFKINIFSCLTVRSFNFKNHKSETFKSTSEIGAEKGDICTINRLEPLKISFFSKIQICKDCYVLRFLLPQSDKTAGFKICHYVLLEATLPNLGEVVKREYHPISLDTDKGFIDFLIRVYPHHNNDNSYGSFSNYLADLEVR